MPRALLLVLLVGAIGCEPTTIVSTTVTAPTPVTQTPFLPTSGGSCTPTATCPSPCSPTSTCTGGLNPPSRSAPPEIFSFDADNRRVTKGTPTVMRWDSGDFNAQVRIDPGIGSVGAVGFVVVVPRETTTYTLTARNAFGTAQRQLTIVVVSPE